MIVTPEQVKQYHTTDQPRRVYLAQYTGETIRRNTGEIWGLAVPFVQNGKNVTQ